MTAKKAHLPDPEPDTELPEPEAPDIPTEHDGDPQPESPLPLSASAFDQQRQPTWVDSYTAATDNPLHPLHHLKGA